MKIEDMYVKWTDLCSQLQHICMLNGYDFDYVYDRIAEIPIADVRLVVPGHWIDKPTGAYGRWQSWCSACNKHSGIGGIESNRHKPFCPNCGAKMDGGDG